jgi:pyruvate ferredoxin oxidoreductase gamma subunit
VKEVRWHARAGQGAKTASHLLAVAQLRTGLSVQAFPEYGPERRGAPIRAYNRFDQRPIRRHDTVTQPDVVIVLDASLLKDGKVGEGLEPGGHLLINSNRPVEGAICIPASSLAPASVNLVMLGALAAVLDEPSLETLGDAATELLGKKADPVALRAAIAAGYHATKESLICAA